MNGIHRPKEKDQDLTRIFQLYDIVKKYESLVEHLLANEHYIVDFDKFDMRTYLDHVEQQVITQAYNQTGGNVLKMSQMTGRSRMTISRRLVEYGIIKEDESSTEIQEQAV